MRKLSMKRKSKSESKSDVNSVDSSDNQEKDLNKTNENVENDNSSKRGKKKNKKNKKTYNDAESNGTEDSALTDEQYEVEAVLDQKTVKGVKHFLIRWKGYGSDSDTWEPESTLDCEELIEKFLSSQKIPDSNKKSKNNKRKSQTSSTKPSKKARSDDNEDSGEGEYEVDRIIEVHHKKNGKREFLVHWKGYSATDNTWEPEENMNCPDLIEKFMAKVTKAKESEARELRVNRTPTKPFTLSMVQSGRRLSRRNLGKQRAQYKDTE